MFHISDWLPTLLHFAGVPAQEISPGVMGIDHYQTFVYGNGPQRKEMIYFMARAYRYIILKLIITYVLKYYFKIWRDENT